MDGAVFRKWVLKARSPDVSFAIVLSAALLTLLFSLVLLGQNLRMRVELGKLTAGFVRTRESFAGRHSSSVASTHPRGQKKIISYSDHNRVGFVLLFFSPRCRVCAEQFPLWEQLFSEIGRECYEVLAVSLDPPEQTQSWARDHRPTIEVVSLPNRTFWRAYRVTAIPETVVISPGGVISWAHPGLLRESEAYRQLLSLLKHCYGNRGQR